MIKTITENDLSTCLNVIQCSFATVAAEFGVTKQNCPNHTSFMKLEILQKRFLDGCLMFKFIKRNKIIGYVSLNNNGNGTFELNNLAVLPDYRHNSYGKQLIQFAKTKIQELGGNKIVIGIIEENKILKDWYTENGFVHIGTKKFDHLPFTVGFMEMEI